MPCQICRSLTFPGPMNTKQQETLLKSWYDDTLQSCFPEAGDAFRLGGGFSNPVSQSFREGMTAILAGLAAGRDLESIRAPLDRIVRVLAVQGLPPGASIRFVFLLRYHLESAPDIPVEEKQIWSRRLDALAEMSVEIWTECRETLFQLRINELRKRIQQLEACLSPNGRGGLPDGQDT